MPRLKSTYKAFIDDALYYAVSFTFDIFDPWKIGEMLSKVIQLNLCTYIFDGRQLQD